MKKVKITVLALILALFIAVFGYNFYKTVTAWAKWPNNKVSLAFIDKRNLN